VKADRSYACWNWALPAIRATGISPAPFYAYVTGFYSWADLLALPNISVVRRGAIQARLDELKAAWAPFQDAAHNAGKTAQIERMSHELAGIVAYINELILSPVKTDYELCNHVPAHKPESRAVSAQARDEDERGRGPNYDHWWLRIGGNVTAETFPGLASVQVVRDLEEDRPNLTVPRHYIAGLHQEHVTQIMAIIENKKRHTPFTPCGARQNCQLDRAANSCKWCGTVFGTFLPRRDHCRRCSLIFCDDCSSQRDRVNYPANERNLPLAAADNQRVCVTWYTPNN
jgi:hypothetical protein